MNSSPPVVSSFAALVLLSTLGCGGTDPLVGDWKSDYQNEGSNDVFQITDDEEVCEVDRDREELCGRGDFFLPHFCNGFIEVPEVDDDNLKYTIEVGFLGCDSDLTFQCTMSEDEKKLKCNEGRSFTRVGDPP